MLVYRILGGKMDGGNVMIIISYVWGKDEGSWWSLSENEGIWFHLSKIVSYCNDRNIGDKCI